VPGVLGLAIEDTGVLRSGTPGVLTADVVVTGVLTPGAVVLGATGAEVPGARGPDEPADVAGLGDLEGVGVRGADTGTEDALTLAALGTTGLGDLVDGAPRILEDTGVLVAGVVVVEPEDPVARGPADVTGLLNLTGDVPVITGVPVRVVPAAEAGGVGVTF